MLESVLMLSLIGLPLFYWHQNELSRMIPLIFIAGIAGIITLVHGVNASWSIINDYGAISMLCFALWIMASITWTESSQSVYESYAFISLLFLSYLCRYADPGVILGTIMVMGVAFSLPSIYYKLKKEKDLMKRHFIFGNQVHNAAFTIIPLFISLWATINISPYFAIASLIMFANFWVNPSRGAIIGLAAGLFTTSTLMFGYWSLLSLIVVPILIFDHYCLKERDKKRRIGHFLSRFIYWTAAVQMIRRRYLYGHGLNMFRKLYPDINPSLFTNPKMVELYKKTGGIERNTGHRPHNDLLDITVELGLIGLLIFCSIFYYINWSSIDPLFIGAFVAYAVMSMFFFPLREVHTSIGFWAFVGVLMGQGVTVPVTIDPVLGIVAIAIILRILYATGVKFMGLYFFNRAMNPKLVSEREANIRAAVGCDPYRSRYLMYAFLFHVEKHPELAFEYSMRQLMHFDGGKVKWGVYDQFARAVMRYPSLNIAEAYVLKALRICPEYERSKELLEFIEVQKKHVEKIQNMEAVKRESAIASQKNKEHNQGGDLVAVGN